MSTTDTWLRAGLVLVALCAALLSGRAWAGDATTATARPAAPATSAKAPVAAVQVQPVTQEALLARQARKDPSLFLLDVRTAQEYADGHIAGAVNVPHEQLASRLSEVPKDKDVVIYCRSGRRAAIAADVLATHGYSRLAHLEGDMNAWLEQGRAVVK